MQKIRMLSDSYSDQQLFIFEQHFHFAVCVMVSDITIVMVMYACMSGTVQFVFLRLFIFL